VDDVTTSKRSDSIASSESSFFYFQRWNKVAKYSRSVRIRSENIITEPSGVKGAARSVKTECECVFMTDIMLNNVILTHTNN